MLKAYQYRLYPTKAQITCLNQTLEICRKVYNNTLALRQYSWKYDQKNVSLFDTNKELTQWKQEFPELKSVFSQVLMNAQVRVDLAFKAFFRRVKTGEDPGYPRFKGFGRYDSFTYPQFGFKIDEKSIYCSKIGDIKTIFHRPMEGRVKTVTIRRTNTQKWYVSIACEDVPLHILPKSEECVGIDVGVKTFAMLSNGDRVENPKFYQKEEENLAKVSRKLSSCVKGSIAFRKARKPVARIHERILNRREDFTQKLSRSLVNRYGVICFEDLSIKDLLETSRCNKSIMDAAWSKLVQYTSYKAEDAGRSVIMVNPSNTTQMCSRCGQIVAKGLSERQHDCPHCGYSVDRDLNAAINILRLGLQSHIKAHGQTWE